MGIDPVSVDPTGNCVGTQNLKMNINNGHLKGCVSGTWQLIGGSSSTGVTSLSGDSVIYNNSSSTGVVTLSPNTIAAHSYYGNNTGSTAVGAIVQPSCSDLSNAAASCATDTTNASNIASGTLNASRLPTSIVQNNQSNTFSTGTQDFHSATHTLPVITAANAGALPGTCTIGELAFVTGATAGQNIYECGSSNTWTQQSGGGSTITIAQGVFASAPTCTSSLNEIYYPIDSVYGKLLCLTGASSYTYFVEGILAVPPTGFSWQNQSGATVDSTHGGEILISNAGGSSNNINGRYVAYPTPPFTRTVCGKIKSIAAASTSITNSNGGLYLSDGTKVELFNIYGTGAQVGISTGPTVTNINANVVGGSGPLASAGSDRFCLRMDDAVTSTGKRTFFISYDGGIKFLQFYQESNTQYLTPTQIGYFVNAYDTNSHIEFWVDTWQ